MRVLAKKFGSIFMAFAVFLTMFSGMQLMDVRARAVEAPTSVAEIRSRLDAVIDGQYGDGVYFPYDSESIPASLGGGVGGCSQCFGYARYVFAQVFGTYAPTTYTSAKYEFGSANASNVEMVTQVTGTNTAALSKAAFLQAKPGDLVQCLRASGYPHTMVVVDVSDTAVTILDCNVYSDNVIHLREETYSDFIKYNSKFSIYRYIYYPEEIVVPAYDKQLSETDTEVDTALALILNQNNNTVRAGKTKQDMISYLLYDSQYAVFGGEDWPVTTNGDQAGSITDSKLSAIDGTTTIAMDTYSWASMSFGWFASGVVYTEDVSHASTRVYFDGSAGAYDKNAIRTYMLTNLQAGEHLRISDTSSLCYISGDDTGFYFMQYGSDDDSDRHIRMRYATYDTFTTWLNATGKEFWYYTIDGDVNGTKAVSGLTVSSISNKTYTGSAIKPTVTVKDGSSVLTKDIHYSVSYSNNTNVGTAKVTITGKGNYSGTKTVTFKIVSPSPAANFKATAGEGKVTLTWSAVSGATKYRIRRHDGTAWSNYKDLTATSFTDTAVTAGTTYKYAVYAYAGGAWGSASAVVSAVPKAAAPATIKATAGNGKVTLTWSAVSGATKYRIRRHDGTKWTNYKDLTATSFTDTAVTAGTTYKYAVYAYAGGAWSSASAIVSAVPSVAAPTTIKATAGNGKVTLTWSAVSGATKYRIRRNDGSGWVNYQDLTATSFTDTAVTNGTKYSYAVYAYAGGTWSNASAIVSAVPASAAVAQNVKAVSASGMITVSWNAVDGATKYRIRRHDGSGWVNYKDLTERAYADTSVTAGKTYKYAVYAYVNGAWGGASAIVSATAK